MLNFFYKRPNLIAAIFCINFFLLALFSTAGFDWKNLKYSGMALTSDEVSHIPAGYYYLKDGRYFINSEHPPLVKDIAALPLLILNPILPSFSDSLGNSNVTGFPFIKGQLIPKEMETENDQWDFGRMVLYYPGNDPDLITFWARTSLIFFNSVLIFILYLSLKKFWNPRTALIGTFFITISQFMIAHGSLVVMDFMSSIMLTLGIVWFSGLASALDKAKNFKDRDFIFNFIITALFFFLALVSKFSTILIFPITLIGGLIFFIFGSQRAKKIRNFILVYFALSVLVILLVGIFYSFHIRNMQTEEVLGQLRGNYPAELPKFGLGFLEFLANLNIVTRGLVEYVVGNFQVFIRLILSNQRTYFMGNVYGKEGAGALYYPVLFLTKLPLAIIVFFLGVTLLKITNFFRLDCAKRWFLDFIKNPLSLLLLICLYSYTLAASSNTLHIGLRYIMPVIFTSIVLLGKGIDSLWDTDLFNKIKSKHIFFALSALMILDTYVSFPYYLSYYNPLGGGTGNGYKIATDSNYDWLGQDLKLLAKWKEENGVKTIYTDIFTMVPQKYYLGPDQKDFSIEKGFLPPSGSYIAVSIFNYQNNLYDKKTPTNLKYTMLSRDYIGKMGTTILIYKIK